jgi:hypothetical protein
MLRDPVWRLTGLAADDGVLCLDDIERRLGRRLQLSDFAMSRTKADFTWWPRGQLMLPKVRQECRITRCNP